MINNFYYKDLNTGKAYFTGAEYKKEILNDDNFKEISYQEYEALTADFKKKFAAAVDYLIGRNDKETEALVNEFKCETKKGY